MAVAPEAPQVLRVDCRDPLYKGVYELEPGVVANGKPLWKTSGDRPRWLFSNFQGHWCIYGQRAEIASVVAWLWLDTPHQGKMPDVARGQWMHWEVSAAEAVGFKASPTQLQIVRVDGNGRSEENINDSHDKSWSIEQSRLLAKASQMKALDGQVMLLDTTNSITDAVRLLREGSILCPEGFCVVYSERMKAYYVLYRSDKKDIAFEALQLDGGSPPNEVVNDYKRASDGDVAAAQLIQLDLLTQQVGTLTHTRDTQEVQIKELQAMKETHTTQQQVLQREITKLRDSLAETTQNLEAEKSQKNAKRCSQVEDRLKESERCLNLKLQTVQSEIEKLKVDDADARKQLADARRQLDEDSQNRTPNRGTGVVGSQTADGLETPEKKKVNATIMTEANGDRQEYVVTLDKSGGTL
jgi:hypothetical protein